METTQKDLPSGGRITCFEEMKHKTVRLIGIEVRKYFSQTKLSIPQDGRAPMISGGVDVDFSKIDFTAVNDIMILGQVTEWSFGPKVDQDTLDEMSEESYSEIREILDGMYGSPLVKSLGLSTQKSSSEPSNNQGEQSTP